MRQVFPAAATKGWSLLHKHNAELLKCAAALRDLKLLVVSGGLDFNKNMDSLNKHVAEISFRHWVAFSKQAAERLIAPISTIVH